MCEYMLNMFPSQYIRVSQYLGTGESLCGTLSAPTAEDHADRAQERSAQARPR